DARVAPVQVVEDVERAVPAPVVHEDDRPLDAERLHDPGDLGVRQRQHLLLVERRDDEDDARVVRARLEWNRERADLFDHGSSRGRRRPMIDTRNEVKKICAPTAMTVNARIASRSSRSSPNPRAAHLPMTIPISVSPATSTSSARSEEHT